MYCQILHYPTDNGWHITCGYKLPGMPLMMRMVKVRGFTFWHIWHVCNLILVSSYHWCYVLHHICTWRCRFQISQSHWSTRYTVPVHSAEIAICSSLLHMTDICKLSLICHEQRVLSTMNHTFSVTHTFSIIQTHITETCTLLFTLFYYTHITETSTLLFTLFYYTHT
jgi:hypothetical protein